MSGFDAVTYAVWEAIAYVVGRVVGRTFSLDRKHAQIVGGYFVIGVIVVAAVALTAVYP